MGRKFMNALEFDHSSLSGDDVPHAGADVPPIPPNSRMVDCLALPVGLTRNVNRWGHADMEVEFRAVGKDLRPYRSRAKYRLSKNYTKVGYSATELFLWRIVDAERWLSGESNDHVVMVNTDDSGAVVWVCHVYIVRPALA